MKKLIAIIFALTSGIYLLTIGIALDPLPFLDEGVAIFIFMKATSYLGFDIKRLFGEGARPPAKNSSE